MKQKKLFLTITAVLHFCVYSMEKQDTIPDDYFKVGLGYLPNIYQNDVQLGNIYYCYATSKYAVKESVKETLERFSKFPELNETRDAHPSAWDYISEGDGLRTVPVYQKEQREAYLNGVAFFLESKNEKLKN